MPAPQWSWSLRDPRDRRGLRGPASDPAPATVRHRCTSCADYRGEGAAAMLAMRS
jgi:hypothetical protein